MLVYLVMSEYCTYIWLLFGIRSNKYEDNTSTFNFPKGRKFSEPSSKFKKLWSYFIVKFRSRCSFNSTSVCKESTEHFNLLIKTFIIWLIIDQITIIKIRSNKVIKDFLERTLLNFLKIQILFILLRFFPWYVVWNLISCLNILLNVFGNESGELVYY